jgi:formylglycine-generating enzyme required for sulfatase activity
MARKLRSTAGTVAALSLAAGLSAFSAEEFASSAAAAEPPQAGQNFRDCTDGCPEMVVVPAGSFMMGSAEFGEGPPRRVTIAKPFGVGKFEVTFAEWEACVAGRGCGRNPDDSRWGRGKRPVINVSWDDAKQYVAWLSRKTGKNYRLLTEAEWEYAARAGSTTLYSWGDDIGRGNAHCTGCGSPWNENQTAPVGSFKPNAFGLHDMHGNVWEWVEDCWDLDLTEAPSDGRARESGCPDDQRRVQRGGAFLHEPRVLRSTVRNSYGKDNRANGVGFRVARTL